MTTLTVCEQESCMSARLRHVVHEAGWKQKKGGDGAAAELIDADGVAVSGPGWFVLNVKYNIRL